MMMNMMNKAQQRSAGNGTSDGCDRKYHHRYGVDYYYNIATQRRNDDTQDAAHDRDGLRDGK